MRILSPAPAYRARLGAAALVLAIGGGLVGAALLLALAAAYLGGSGALGAVDLDGPGDVALDDLEQRSVVYAADGSVVAELHDEHDRREVALDEVAAPVVAAVLVAEDRRFLEHDGYDLAALTRAGLANLRAGGVEQGGSTISQQLAKRNFVGDAQTFGRKVEELLHAMALERDLDKGELLERYLNEVYFGGGAYGIAAASEEFFRAEPDELTAEQAALLAGMIRSPSALDPRGNPEGAAERRDAVLAAMAEEGVLDDEEAAALRGREIDVAEPRERVSEEPYVTAAVTRELLADPALGDDVEDREARLLAGGLEIHTTIDPELQERTAELVAEHTDDMEPSAAVVVVEPASGAVRAVHGGADHDDRQFDLATQGRRQPGSAFKTFGLIAALEQGMPLEATLEGDSGAEFDAVEGWDAEGGGVRNFGGRDLGRVELREATEQSVNTAFAELALLIGPEAGLEVAERLGIDAEAATDGQSGPATALGGLERGVTALELASAYAVLGHDGQRVEPTLVDEVVDREGTSVRGNGEEAERVMDPAVNAAVVDVLRGVVDRGTGQAAALADWPVAGKTGTSQDFADAWFAGTTPELAAAVWVGHPAGAEPMDDVTGGSVPAALFADVMEAAHADREPRGFDLSDADLAEAVAGEEVTVPDLVGIAEADAEAELTEALLSADAVRVDDPAPAGTVIGHRPRPGREVTVGEEVTLWVSTGRASSPPDDEDDEAEEHGDDEDDEAEEHDEDGDDEAEEHDEDEDDADGDDDGEDGDDEGDDSDDGDDEDEVTPPDDDG